MNMEQILKSLSKKKPLFRSKKDFQYWLCEEIQNHCYKCYINGTLSGRKVDLLVEDTVNNKSYAIQLFNKTSKLSVSVQGEMYDLKQHGAQDQGRYDFIKSVAFLENLIGGHEHVHGMVILLTNDHLYWSKPTKNNSVDQDFLLYDGRKITGELRGH